MYDLSFFFLYCMVLNGYKIEGTDIWKQYHWENKRKKVCLGVL